MDKLRVVVDVVEEVNSLEKKVLIDVRLESDE